MVKKRIIEGIRIQEQDKRREDPALYEYLGKTVEISGCSSADETTVVETKSRKKKKNKVNDVAVKVLCPQTTVIKLLAFETYFYIKRTF